MKFTATEEREMLTYSIRFDFSDGTFDIMKVTASSIAEAFELCGIVEGMTGSTLLGSVDHAKQVCLA